MADIRTVDGLDVTAGQLLRHSSGVVVRVTGSARKKVGRDIVNVVQVERTDNGQRGYLELKAGQSFTVGAGLAKRSGNFTEAPTPRPPQSRRKFYARSRSPLYDNNAKGYPSQAEAERVASTYPEGYVSNRPPD